MKYYIHGFGSDNSSRTGQFLKSIFKDDIELLHYDSTKTCEEILNQLNAQLHQDDKERIFIGTSLGGYFSIRLAKETDTYNKLLLINPSTNPKKELKPISDIYESFPETFEFPECAISIIIGQLDNVVDWQETYKKFKNRSYIELIENAGHSLKDLNVILKHLEELENVI